MVFSVKWIKMVHLLRSAVLINQVSVYPIGSVATVFEARWMGEKCHGWIHNMGLSIAMGVPQ